MSVVANPLHPLFAAGVEDIDLREALGSTEVREIERLMDEKSVLVFRGQPLSQDQQIAFARNFGPLEGGFIKVNQRPSRFKYAELADISNVSLDGKVAQRDAREVVGNFANQLWHSDSSFQQPAARYSMLSAVVVPPSGGDTEFCDMRAAYDALPRDLQSELEGLRAEHYALNSRFLLGDTDYSEAQRNAMPPVNWPLVRTHAGSGRKFLFIGAHASHVEGLPVAEGRMLLAELLEHATQREFVYRHRWNVGDLVMWDNRCVLHRGRRYDISARRELRRATTLDDAVV
ncbi:MULTISPECIES: alpha-ketoglutarate-dependent 2,4-dichlorophenoxyacetate dioxygenase [Burkholderiaceae]|uniref:Alpha-ketoglutarate-dependent 2,4-dichlorophenoxyacetate dioxygenase n=37 Tax=Pseudomonadota TaxID=1224 RepID=TFDA_CUPPJ|nr:MULTISPECIES: alpha-ketoglutarate-dependent 2,4-dichlorophenoxyacetate dioxygenase [Burkholderiaceae]P10088.1 RecName: Full=Alpha-ketoglutarate-dependent 2,4-dichlorophenoxyacetate dioxygenase; Short=2,4-D dioxygenase [Cupriavidus pinatubonensis JMP134]ACF35489.1 TfdA [Burkholderia sp. TFD19]ACF35490.1 TfdA [Cupriavidus sp. TFD33]ACF35491.1 TfdA [Cupriavidus sp. TFD38]ACF35492.1 TfdA [Pseudomonas sp. TFD39]ACF35493.1 TfdA [Cupriavidus sp. TFD51]AQH05915.1 2,4-dichlorophenoxyacetate dioxyg